MKYLKTEMDHPGLAVLQDLMKDTRKHETLFLQIGTKEDTRPVYRLLEDETPDSSISAKLPEWED